MQKTSSSPANLPRQNDRTSEEHAALVTRIKQVERYSDDVVQDLRTSSRDSLIQTLANRDVAMDREDRATFSAVSRRYAMMRDAHRSTSGDALEAADTTLARLGRRNADREIADELDAARLVEGHRRVYAVGASRRTRDAAIEI